MNDKPIRACADCEQEHGILNRSDYSKSHGQCRRHWIRTLLDDGVSSEEIADTLLQMSPDAFPPDLGPVSKTQ